jgi:hypothetical protein
MVPWPHHGKKLRRAGYVGSAGKPQDVEWLVLGTPVKAMSGWECGTDVVWPVLGIDPNPPGFEMLEQAYVCRHQIIAGD